MADDLPPLWEADRRGDPEVMRAALDAGRSTPPVMPLPDVGPCNSCDAPYADCSARAPAYCCADCGHPPTGWRHRAESDRIMEGTRTTRLSDWQGAVADAYEADRELLRQALARAYPGAELYLDPGPETIELADGTGEVIATVPGRSQVGVFALDPQPHDAIVHADGFTVPVWLLSWPSGASEPVWAPELPEIAPRPAQGN